MTGLRLYNILSGGLVGCYDTGNYQYKKYIFIYKLTTIPNCFISALTISNIIIFSC